MNFINVVGEELIIDNAEKALVIACAKTGAVVNEYTAAPVYKDNDMTHQWLIEFEKEPTDKEFFREAFDNALKSLNSDYGAKRYQNLILNAPVINVLPKGSFYKWMKKRDKLGGQNKVPRLSNERKYVDEILALLDEK